MSLTVTYAPRCNADVKRMHYRPAERVCIAVLAFAQTGSGDVEPCDPDDPYLIRIRASGGFALARLRPSENALEVHAIYGTPPARPVVRLL
jgi:hypothetical protein